LGLTHDLLYHNLTSRSFLCTADLEKLWYILSVTSSLVTAYLRHLPMQKNSEISCIPYSWLHSFPRFSGDLVFLPGLLKMAVLDVKNGWIECSWGGGDVKEG
jgi:hypothetical protein